MKRSRKKLKYEHPIMLPLREDSSAAGVCDPGSVGDGSDECKTGYAPIDPNCDNGTKAGTCDANGSSF